ncbi:CHASE2 domain-containing protein [Oculatella sp. LEGE 06141]|uniref:CHASE2 domain-containing protein n=1 Tax=Oculatella sp. LEGE 06141 TaxID=1828648 RepID=UPI00187E9908|nr:CHASE2 domain-containing protein [Oculatella sp. LEGE 06141]MBE9182945.1 CHASE2 domain-containing protein [Oculatella sp. LEGE 06141]
MNRFRLKVQKVEQHCLFELSWGQAQQMVATLTDSPALAEHYQDWRRIYLSFYKTAEIPLFPTSPIDPGLRGRKIIGGELVPAAIDWHTKLVEAEIKLLNEFYRWLRGAELFEIRATLARASQVSDRLDLVLTCTGIELARLPWEAWEIGADFAATGAIRIVRTPATIRSDATFSARQPRGRARILAILGDDTGLNFQTDREAVRSLDTVAEVTFVGWQPGQTAAEVKTQIRDAIAAQPGWDVLFFAGHSNEAETTGGELVIAPNVSITIHDIAPQLTAARERGLQVAIFNSCSGLSIAEFLIDFGFGQVAVMREPIHNRVAQEFLVQFLRGLANRQDVHESLRSACRFLRLEKNLTYPSAYLVPALFCHPNAPLFRLASGWKQRWAQRFQSLLPSRLEAIVLAVGIALSLSPAQAVLLNTRLWMQAVYRDFAHQVPAQTEPPPIALIQIDTASLSRARLSKLQPIDRRYLAKLLDRLTELNASVIGIDFVLDTPQPEDAALQKAIQTAIARHQTWLVFGAALDDQAVEVGVHQTQIASPAWSLQANIDANLEYVMLPYPDEDCRQTCPFTYLLSLVHTAQLHSTDLPEPTLHQTANLRSQLLDTIDAQRPPSQRLTAVRQLHLAPISIWAYDRFGQHWLEPIVDYSIPSDRAYERISAWQVLDANQPPANFSEQIVIIAPGADERLGMAPGEPDRFPRPTALRYWQPQTYWLTGGEANAYMVHHQLNQRLVIPIPDLWMLAIAVLLAKVVRLRRRSPWTPKQHLAGLSAATLLYGLLSLQLYISAAVLLPWLLPTALFWAYRLPALKRQPHGQLH